MALYDGGFACGRQSAPDPLQLQVQQSGTAASVWSLGGRRQRLSSAAPPPAASPRMLQAPLVGRSSSTRWRRCPSAAAPCGTACRWSKRAAAPSRSRCGRRISTRKRCCQRFCSLRMPASAFRRWVLSTAPRTHCGRRCSCPCSTPRSLRRWAACSARHARGCCCLGRRGPARQCWRGPPLPSAVPPSLCSRRAPSSPSGWATP
mmetsp:Transcript_24358/g.67717  ORF Transcript_24358/g.67717 Transcript_24358/m.67717 type:complete len:204 (-) Transcript_24358:852-1463(-)